MRTMFYEYPDDKECWKIEDTYFYGPDILVAPVCYANQKKRKLYLPGNTVWVEYETGKEYSGQNWIEVSAPIESIPIFVKKASEVKEILEL